MPCQRALAQSCVVVEGGEVGGGYEIVRIVVGGVAATVVVAIGVEVVVDVEVVLVVEGGCERRFGWELGWGKWKAIGARVWGMVIVRGGGTEERRGFEWGITVHHPSFAWLPLLAINAIEYHRHCTNYKVEKRKY